MEMVSLLICNTTYDIKSYTLSLMREIWFIWYYFLWYTSCSSKSPHNTSYIKPRDIRNAVQTLDGQIFITMTSWWARLRLKSPASRLFTQRFIQAEIKENIKAPRHWPSCGEFTGTGEFPAQMASNAENVSIWWRHHVSSNDESNEDNINIWRHMRTLLPKAGISGRDK